MCEGVWALFEGAELHSLWSEEDIVKEFLEENDIQFDPEYTYTWIRIED